MKRHAANNPFRISRLQALKWHPMPDCLQTLYQRWQGQSFRGQIVGPHGVGKTTLCLQLISLANDNGIATLELFSNKDTCRQTFRDWSKELESISSKTCVLIDGYEHAPWQKRRRYLKRCNRMLLAVHKPIKGVPIIGKLNSSLLLLQELVLQLAGKEGLSLLGNDGGEYLLEKCNGNIREVFRTLYFHWLKDETDRLHPLYSNPRPV